MLQTLHLTDSLYLTIFVLKSHCSSYLTVYVPQHYVELLLPSLTVTIARDTCSCCCFCHSFTTPFTA